MRLVNSSLTRLNCPGWRPCWAAHWSTSASALRPAPATALHSLAYWSSETPSTGSNPGSLGSTVSGVSPTCNASAFSSAACFAAGAFLAASVALPSVLLMSLKNPTVFLLVLELRANGLGWRGRYIAVCDMSVPMRLATCWYGCMGCDQALETYPH